MTELSVAESGAGEVAGVLAVGADDRLIEQLIAGAQAGGLRLTGEGGLLQQLTKRVLESALEGELTDHLGHGPGERAEGGRENYRNGRRTKTVTTEVGPVEIEVPRDRNGTFEPVLVKKRQRRLTGVDEMVLSLSAKGLTHGEISAHLAEVYGASVSKQTISTITDSVVAGMLEWQNRPRAWITGSGTLPAMSQEPRAAEVVDSRLHRRSFMLDNATPSTHPDGHYRP